ncbi:hypothetical protein Mal15_69280 [Stieleria maiorica]|uniref:Uncharacterized protein n=1 Tax=Stieleria maiorica TaxID=2795974 RepID=A0A5B9MRT9_9BACT|nr:hypothetical protein [Stieleria maiorica]QEG02807.1 hypothetical protein Mal15_69280 [Stieleria maiorica]
MLISDANGGGGNFAATGFELRTSFDDATDPELSKKYDALLCKRWFSITNPSRWRIEGLELKPPEVDREAIRHADAAVDYFDRRPRLDDAIRQSMKSFVEVASQADSSQQAIFEAATRVAEAQLPMLAECEGIGDPEQAAKWFLLTQVCKTLADDLDQLTLLFADDPPED